MSTLTLTPLTPITLGLAGATPGSLAFNGLGLYTVTAAPYNAKGDGVTDDYAAIQAAITAANGRGIIYLPPGTYYLSNAADALLLPPSATCLRICGAGVGATTIKLSSNTPRAFDFNRTADYQTFQNIEISDLTVDRNNVTSASNEHVLVGNLVGGAWGAKSSFDNIAVRRCATLNVPISGSISYQNVSIAGYHSASAQTQTTITDVTVEDCDFAGGNCGVVIFGSGSAYTSGLGVNVYHDRIYVRRITHDTGTVPSGTTGSFAHVQLGGVGFGESCVVEDIHGANSWDVGIEIDGFQSATVERCEITDAWNAAYGSYNWRSPRDAYSQVYRYRDCRARLSSVAPAAAHACIGWECGSPNVAATQWFGHVLLDECVHDNATGSFNANGVAVSCRAGAGLRRLTLKSFESNTPSVSQTLAADGVASVVFLDPSSVVPFTFKADGVRVRVAGATTLSGHTFTSYGIRVVGSDTAGADITLDVRDYQPDWNMTGTAAGSTYLAFIGPSSAPSTLPKFRGGFNFRVKAFAGGDTAPYGAYVADFQGATTPVLSLDNDLMFRDCDGSKLPAGSAGASGAIGREVYVKTQQDLKNTGQYGVFTPGLRLCVTAGIPRVASPGTLATATTYVNRTGYTIWFWLTGAMTITQVDIGVRSDTTLVTIPGATSAGPYVLTPGAAIKFAMTSGPGTINYIASPV